MFQTSRPNGRDLAALTGDIKRPVANSMAADIYDLMPNDTDVTEFMALNIDAANFAFVQGSRFYHTPSDNLSNLDKRTLFHSGANALAAVEAFLNMDASVNEGQWIYSDILGGLVLKLPQVWSLPLIGLAGGLTFLVFVMKGGAAPVRSALFPIVALVFGVVLAISASWIVTSIRPEAYPGAANPWALRGVQTAAALLGATFALMLLCRQGAKQRLLLSGWIWAAIIAGCAAVFIPGSAILFVPSMVVVAVAAIVLLLGWKAISQILFVFAAIVFAVICMPLAAMGETALFIEQAAPFVFVILFLAIFLIPFVLPEKGFSTFGMVSLFAVPGSLLIGFLASSFLVPAYSVDAPRHLSVLHAMSADEDGAVWAVWKGEVIPEEMAKGRGFSVGVAKGLPGERLVADAPEFDTSGVSVVVLSDDVLGADRTIKLEIAAPDADRIWLSSNSGNLNPSAIAINAHDVDYEDDTLRSLVCHGRYCRTMSLSMTMPAESPEFSMTFTALSDGLGPESAELLNARPDWALPIQWGDMRALSASITIPASSTDPE